MKKSDKLTNNGFALPTALMLSVVLLAVLLGITYFANQTSRTSTAQVKLTRATDILQIGISTLDQKLKEGFEDWPSRIITDNEHIVIENDSTKGTVHFSDLLGEYKIKAYRTGYQVSANHLDAKGNPILTYCLTELVMSKVVGGVYKKAIRLKWNKSMEGSTDTIIPLFGAPLITQGATRIGGGMQMHWGPVFNFSGGMDLGTSDQTKGAFTKIPAAFTTFPRKYASGKIKELDDTINNPITLDIRGVNNKSVSKTNWGTSDFGKMIGQSTSDTLLSLMNDIDLESLAERAKNFDANWLGGTALVVDAAGGWDGSGFMNLANVASTDDPTITFDNWYLDKNNGASPKDPVFYIADGDCHILIKGNSCIGDSEDTDNPVIFIVDNNNASFHLKIDSSWTSGARNTFHDVEVPVNAWKEYQCTSDYGRPGLIQITAKDFWDASGWASGTATLDNVFMYGALVILGNGFADSANETNVDVTLLGLFAKKSKDFFWNGGCFSLYYSHIADGALTAGDRDDDFNWNFYYSESGASEDDWDIFESTGYRPFIQR